MILAIESSCDETAAALVTDDGELRASVVASQDELHAPFGGVVPEVASRRHLELVVPVIREALADAGADLSDVDAIAVTAKPGLIGALARRRVGGEGARLVAAAAADPGRPSARPRRVALPPAARPRAAVHLPARERRAHDAARRPGSEVPTACSGRRSTMRRGRPSTRARGCSGSAIREGRRSTRSRPQGDPSVFAFPVARVPGLDFSFSGLKTALLYAVRDLSPAELAARRADLAAGYQHAIVRALVERLHATGAERIAVVGGVAANSELRAALPDATLAPLALCTDNAAMIGSAARYLRPVPYPEYLSLDAQAG